MEPTEQEVTAIIDALGPRQNGTLKEKFATVYNELRALARTQRRGWFGLETLSTTVLVHEAYIRLSQSDGIKWQNQEHFFRIAARAMRFILINYVERNRAAKRGGNSPHVSIDEVPLAVDSEMDELLALDKALTRLASRNPRWALVVECRVFAGWGVEETAAALTISQPTVKRDWRHAQAWLYRELQVADHQVREPA